jgi:type IV secretory pathway VirB10-like protein
MSQPVANSQTMPPAEPELRQVAQQPKGVLRKNLKPALYLGAAALVIVAAIFSGTGKKNPTPQTSGGHHAAQPTLQDNTDNNVQDLKQQVATAQQRAAQEASRSLPTPDPAPANATPGQQPTVVGYGSAPQSFPCIPGQPCTQPQSAYLQQQLSPAEQEEQQLAAKERELTYSSRFASNIVYSRTSDQTPEQQPSTVLAEKATARASSDGDRQDTAPSSLIAPRPTGDLAPSSAEKTRTADQRRPEVNIDAASGQPYVLYEGTTLDCILMNRLDGDAVGQVKVLVSNPVYSHDRQHVLIPEGTTVLGEARKIGSTGLGQQRRMVVVFHRMIMPDGYSADLDQFHGLDQIGEEGVRNRTNNHYLQIFGTSIALGVISGAGEIEQGGGTISTSGSQAFATGGSASVSQSATTILDRFMQIPPTITIREGHRIKVYFVQDMLLPAYENHTIPQTF